MGENMAEIISEIRNARFRPKCVATRIIVYIYVHRARIQWYEVIIIIIITNNVTNRLSLS